MREDELKRWVEEKLKEGFEPEVLRKVLKERGFNSFIVDDVLPNRKKRELDGLKFNKRRISLILLMTFFSLILLLGIYRITRLRNTNIIRSDLTNPTDYVNTPMSEPVFIEENIIPITPNPDLIFDTSKYYAKFNVTEKDVLRFTTDITHSWVWLMGEEIEYEDTYPWRGDAYYYEFDLPRNSSNRGVFVLHPKRDKSCREIFTEVNIPNDTRNYYLCIKSANIAKMIGVKNVPACVDVIMRVSIKSIGNPINNKTYYIIVNWTEWKYNVINLNNWKNEKVLIRIEGCPGGPCGEWSHEWLGIDKIFVGHNG